jgi:hypothetical protein
MKSTVKLILGTVMLVVFVIASAGWILACLGANAERGMPSVWRFVLGFFALDVAGPILIFLGLAFAGFALACSGWRDLRWLTQEGKNPEPMEEPNKASQDTSLRADPER